MNKQRYQQIISELAAIDPAMWQDRRLAYEARIAAEAEATAKAIAELPPKKEKKKRS